MTAERNKAVGGKIASYVIAIDPATGAEGSGETVELGATSLAALESITASGPLTDAQLRATPVPISGPLTDAQLTTQLAALAILLEHVFVSQEAATVPTATTMQAAATSNGNGTSLPVTGYATAILQITGMSGGVTTVNFEGSADGGTTWVAVIAPQLGTAGSQATTATADGDFRINCAGLSHLRARISAYSAGTVTVKGYASPVAGAGTAVAVSNAPTAAAPWPVQGGFTELSALTAGSLNADLVPSTDVSASRSWSLQVLGTYTGSLTWQGSNDNSTWVSIPAWNPGDTTSIGRLFTANAAGIFVGPVMFRYLRVRMTSYTSGTATGVLELSAFPPAPHISHAVAAQNGTWTVQPGNTPNTVPWLASETPKTSGGLSTHKTVSAGSTNATVVKASAGQVYVVNCSNVNAAVRYLKLYDKATAPTVGTDVPVHTFLLPINGNFSQTFPGGIAFAAGIAFALTTEATDAGSTGVSASEHVVNVNFK